MTTTVSGTFRSPRQSESDLRTRALRLFSVTEAERDERATATERGGRTWAPGLDGLRGLALITVFVFHAGARSWLPGGWLGVPVFFALSGYLIGSHALTEAQRTNTFDARSFWWRRARRLLLPLLAFLGVVAVASWFGMVQPKSGWEFLGGLTWTSNIVSMIQGSAYSDLFLEPSPMTHLWSLAIEEQFYVAMPLVMLWAARGRVRERLAMASWAVIACGLIACWITESATTAYYSPLHRAPEIAIGVLAAVLAPLGRGVADRKLQALAAALMVVGVGVMLRAGVPATSGVWTRGGTTVFAAGAVVIAVAASRPGMFSQAFSLKPLRWIGRVSYEAYLWHWPVVIVLDDRSGLSPVALFAIRASMTLGLTAISAAPLARLWKTRFEPTRLKTGKGERGWFKPPALAMAAIILAGTTSTFSPFDSSSAERAASSTPPPPVVTLPLSSKGSGDTGPLEVVMFGDSVANWMLRDGSKAIDRTRVDLIDSTIEACDGAAGMGEIRGRGGDVPEGPTCLPWTELMPQVFQKTKNIDVTLLMTGTHAMLDRKIDGSWRGPCDQVNSQWYTADIAGRLRMMSASSGRAILVLPAWPESNSGWVMPDDGYERAECVRQNMTEAASRLDLIDKVAIVDLADFVCPDGPDSCTYRVEDGIHLVGKYAPPAAAWVTNQAVTEASPAS